MENEANQNSGKEELVATEATVAEGSTLQEAKAEETKPFTQEDLNRIVGERLKRQEKQFLETLGVKDASELASLKERFSAYDKLVEENEALKEASAFRENGVKPERQDDVKIYFKGKGVAFTSESLKEAISTHPEWVEGKSGVIPVGIGKQESVRESEDAIAAKMFGLKNGFLKR